MTEGSSLQLLHDEIHIWSVALEAPADDHCSGIDLLDEAEKARAARLHSTVAASRYISMHAITRSILSRYTAIPPQDIKINVNSFGKPMLAPESGISFNITHSADVGMIAISHHDIGIDVEKIEPDLCFLDIAERFFSARESVTLRSLPPEHQREAFYTCWTRKEAYLKACGCGFSLPTNAFAVSLAPGAPPALLHHELQPTETERWRLVDLPAPSGFRSSLAHQRKTEKIRVVIVGGTHGSTMSVT